MYVNNLYRQAMSQTLPAYAFRWVENTSKFNKDFVENYREDVAEVYFLEVDVWYPERLHEFHNGLPLLPERMKIEKVGITKTVIHKCWYGMIM